MQTETDPWNPDETDCPSETGRTGFACEGCGKTFQKPVLATVLASGQTQKYYACPRCLTRIHDFNPTEKKEEKPPTSTTEPATPTTEPENIGCRGHFFGYLKKREKQTPIPEECLTCAKMLECLSHDAKS